MSKEIKINDPFAELEQLATSLVEDFRDVINDYRGFKGLGAHMRFTLFHDSLGGDYSDYSLSVGGDNERYMSIESYMGECRIALTRYSSGGPVQVTIEKGYSIKSIFESLKAMRETLTKMELDFNKISLDDLKKNREAKIEALKKNIVELENENS